MLRCNKAVTSEEERALIIATAMVSSGCNVAPLLLLSRAILFDKILCRALLASKTCTGPRGRTRLMHAAKAGNFARVTFLLSCGAAVDAATENGTTALHLAAHLSRTFPCTPGHLAVVRLLVERGAAVNATDSEGCTALSLAANPFAFPKENLAMVNTLVELGGDLELGSHHGDKDNVPLTPMALAILLGRWDAATELARLGAKVDAPAGFVNAGHNSLSLACQRGEVETVKKLLDLGADVNFKACRMLAIPLVQLVLMNNGHHEALPGTHLEIFKELLARGASTVVVLGGQTLEEMLWDYEEEGGPFTAALSAHLLRIKHTPTGSSEGQGPTGREAVAKGSAEGGGGGGP